MTTRPDFARFIVEAGAPAPPRRRCNADVVRFHEPCAGFGVCCHRLALMRP